MGASLAGRGRYAVSPSAATLLQSDVGWQRDLEHNTAIALHVVGSPVTVRFSQDAGRPDQLLVDFTIEAPSSDLAALLQAWDEMDLNVLDLLGQVEAEVGVEGD